MLSPSMRAVSMCLSRWTQWLEWPASRRKPVSKGPWTIDQGFTMPYYTRTHGHYSKCDGTAKITSGRYYRLDRTRARLCIVPSARQKRRS